MLTIQSNVSLLPYTTFRIPVQAKYFVEITSEDDLLDLFASPLFQQERKQLLGGGAKTFFTKDFDGLVIKVSIKGISRLRRDAPLVRPIAAHLPTDTPLSIIVRVWAGQDRTAFVKYANHQGRAGIENLIAIPGNVGTAPFSNIGAYGVEVGDRIARVEGYDLTTKEKQTFTHEQCQFGYRTSIFKSTLRNTFLITAVGFQLQPFDESYQFITDYPDVQAALKKSPLPPFPSVLTGHSTKGGSLQHISDIIAAIRSQKLPDMNEIWTLGSFFVNPFVCREHFEALKKLYPEIPFWKVPADISCRDASLTPPNGESVNYDQKEIVKLSAGRLIEQSGLKGYWTGKVGTFPKNALVLINASGTADEVLAVVDHIQQTVKEKFEIELQPEAVYVH